MLLAGFLVVPPWHVPDDHDPLLPPDVVTCSSHLVNRVPNDQTWLTTATDALAIAVPGTSVLAIGLEEPDVEAAVTHLPINPTPWPNLEVLGYEVIGLEHDDLHSALCYGGVPADLRSIDIHLDQHGLIPTLPNARRAADAMATWDVPEDITWLPAALARVT